MTPDTNHVTPVDGDSFVRLYRSLMARRERSRGLWVIVTSVRAGEGVTTVASGLARTMAETDDALYWRLSRAASDPDLDRIGVRWDRDDLPVGGPERADGHGGRVYVITGEAGGPAAGERVKLLRERFRFGVVDAPPVLASSACFKLAGAVDGAVLVVEAAATSWRSAQDAVAALQAAGVPPLGAVLNKTRPALPSKWSRRLGEPCLEPSTEAIR